MPTMISKNRGDVAKEATFILHDTANATYVAVGNSSQSNLAITNVQTIDSVSISKVWFGAANGGYWTISRGANLVFVGAGSDTMQFDGGSINKDPTANLVFTLNGTTTGFIMTEIKAKIR